MYFRVLHDEASGATTYLLADRDACEAVVIDPHAPTVPVVAAMLEECGLRLRWVLRTHEHDDHIAGERQAVESLGAPSIKGRAPDTALLPFGVEFVSVLETPGHTPTCLSFLWRDRLFCGDLLAMEGCPLQRDPAQPESLWESVQRHVFALPPETLIFPGHVARGGSVSTVMEQRRWHPWFGGTSRDEFLRRFPVSRLGSVEPQVRSKDRAARAPRARK